MKTFKALLISIIMLSGQLSFGNGNETCCPDTTSVELLTAGNQAQLDQLQAESYEVVAEVPSLQSIVAQKIQGQQIMLKQVQFESEKMDEPISNTYSKQVELKLNSRQFKLRGCSNKQAVKF